MGGYVAWHSGKNAARGVKARVHECGTGDSDEMRVSTDGGRNRFTVLYRDVYPCAPSPGGLAW